MQISKNRTVTYKNLNGLGWVGTKQGQNCYEVPFSIFYFKISYKGRLLWDHILEYKILGTSELG